MLYGSRTIARCAPNQCLAGGDFVLTVLMPYIGDLDSGFLSLHRLVWYHMFTLSLPPCRQLNLLGSQQRFPGPIGAGRSRE